MTKRLKYEKYNNCNNVITIDLHNGYTIVAISSPYNESNQFNVTLFLKENSTNDWGLVEEAEYLRFETNYKTINAAILKKVSDLLEEGFFDYYIQRYEYELKCFDKGNELIEKEMPGEK